MWILPVWFFMHTFRNGGRKKEERETDRRVLKKYWWYSVLEEIFLGASRSLSLSLSLPPKVHFRVCFLWAKRGGRFEKPLIILVFLNSSSTPLSSRYLCLSPFESCWHLVGMRSGGGEKWSASKKSRERKMRSYFWIQRMMIWMCGVQKEAERKRWLPCFEDKDGWGWGKPPEGFPSPTILHPHFPPPTLLWNSGHIWDTRTDFSGWQSVK